MSLQSLFSGTNTSLDRTNAIVTNLLKYCNKRKTFDKFTNDEKQEVYELIDGLCEIMRSKLNTKYGGNWANFCKDFRHVCQGKKTCTTLPGHRDEKAFIAHITHTLQDWGLFQDYLNIPASRRNDIFRKVRDPPRRNGVEYIRYIGTEIGMLSYFLGVKFNNDRDSIANEVSKIHLRKENVVFLRKFDTDCCKIRGDSAPSAGERKERNDNHDDFIEDLEHVIQALTRVYIAVRY